MPSSTIIFITTNTIWGGSEVLWTHTMKAMLQQGITVKAAAAYPFEAIQFSGLQQEDYFDLKKRYLHRSVFKKGLLKIQQQPYFPIDRFTNWLQQQQPALVVISQGNNLEGYDYMQLCRQMNIKFVTLTHLVVESLWPSLHDEKINSLVELYMAAQKNFFVSVYVLKQHEKILGARFQNSEVVHNPFTKSIVHPLSYPAVKDGIYKVALIGRLENYHKGYDLLLEVVQQQKWQQRPIHFSVFGKGPHRGLLQRTIEQYQVNNVTIEEHREDVESIWQTHHILMMPSRMEGQSLTLIEAMRFKRTVIATNVGGVDELITDGQTGFIAPFSSKESIDATMERAWLQKDNWKEMGELAFAAITQKHSTDAVQNFTAKLLGNLNPVLQTLP
jgi:glycosyltransferase involved in cell wall biosynthesis